MKKRILSLFLAFIMTVMLLAPIPVGAQPTTNVKVDTVQGYISQFVEVKVTAAADMNVSVGKLVIKYDPRLELVSYTNGTVFEKVYSEITGEENGIFTYVADIEVSATKTSVEVKSGAVIVTLKFRIPDAAAVTDEYNVSIVDAQSSFTVTTNTEGVIGAQSIECRSIAGIVGVKSPAECASHTFGEPTTIRTESYLSGGYSYKSCSGCGYVESTFTAPKATNAFTALGTAIRYAGNPAGIGAHFAVNADAIKAVEAAGYTVEVGIELSFGDRIENQVFYGANTPLANAKNFEDGVISAAIEGIPTQKKGTICAYMMITDSTGAGRIERTYTTVSGSERISIVDVVSLMNFNKYSESSRDYLTAVLNGFIE